MSYRIEQLERKVEHHNSFGERIPVLEEQIKVINHRLEDLEKSA
jgi:tetrahydromethanopterin S-methyltransferase subunit G